MLNKIKQLWADLQAERARQRELNVLLENLTDYGFLDRVTGEAKS